MSCLILKGLHSTSNKSSVYFGTNSLNRHSFLRSDPTFIANAIISPYSKYIFYKKLSPYVDIEQNKLFTLNYNTIGLSNRKIIDDWIKNNELKSIKIHELPLIHFLGLDVSKKNQSFKYNEYSGIPYFAIDITNHNSLISQIELQNPNLKTLSTRELINKHIGYKESNIFAQGRMFLQWLSSTKYCQGCGSKTIPINAGSELLCSSSKEFNCPVKNSSNPSNASHPRIDPVLITCVLNSNRDKVLFTRSSQLKKYYTNIAGFIEPAETIEEAVKREVWEESGLYVSQVKIIKSQPWPYPANLMIGCIGIVDSNNNNVENQDFNLNHDKELIEAKWVKIGKLKEIITYGKENEDSIIRVDGELNGIPNEKTIAYQLFKHVVNTYNL
ncbi:hypothetical protein WICMUC_004765 [Wickerhamomyces mucosus]|uniref:NAD(+) diphosphatase n=1 Tax=Wickerhamomyces mucosus TaxID=1378264 RepID=A0A9P8PGT3_9ASCO|nr:hypothetical protein WICMUC_004765 [Wickerhamomyces mucosus]